jgi:hypothetical protein
VALQVPKDLAQRQIQVNQLPELKTAVLPQIAVVAETLVAETLVAETLAFSLLQFFDYLPVF